MRNLTLLNKALLCKWSWCFAVEGEAFWKQVICGKYGEEEGRWHSCEVRERFRVGLWKAIRREWVVMAGYMTFFCEEWEVGRFWKDKWCGNNSLCTSFPSLFAIASSKVAWVEDIWNHSTEGV